MTKNGGLGRGRGSMPLTRRRFLATLGAGSLALASGGWIRGERKPNFVVIVADDLGYADVGFHGGKEIPTPNIDSLAAQGVRFSNGYVSCPVCSPTRAGLMTGRYQQRFGHEFNPGPMARAEESFELAKDEKTIAERLKELGYATGIFGKWHLGYKAGSQPQDRGFDEFFGFLGGAHSYLEAGDSERGPIMRGREPVSKIDYSTDAFALEAAAFVERHKDEPFLLYLPFNAVHGPLEATEKYLERFKNIQDTRRRTFAAMLSAMDDGIGLVLEKLRTLNLDNDTLVFFLSDNGGIPPSNTSGNGPLRAQKGEVYEGGIRVPFAIRWKGRLPDGKAFDEPVIALDIHPTILAAAGGTPPAEKPLDGVDLLPHVMGENTRAPHDRLFWRIGEKQAIRMGDWKLVRHGNDAPELFNLRDDIGEKNNLAEKETDKTRELLAAYDAWNRDMVTPRWKSKEKTPRSRKPKPRPNAAKRPSKPANGRNATTQ